MNHKNNMKIHRTTPALPSTQAGAAILGTVLVLLVVVSMIAIAASKSTILETRMVFNVQDKQRSSIAADSAAMLAWNQVKNRFDLSRFVNNSAQPGFYVLSNDIPLTEASAKSADDWRALEDVTAWPWSDSGKRFSIPGQLGGSENPMQLVSTPQFTAGIHKESFRKGTASYYCIPVSIIGASQGGSANTRTLIELRTIPKSTCYHQPIK